MKRIIIAVVIIAVSVGFAVWGNIKINNILDDVIVTLDNDSNSAYELWQKNRDFLGIFLVHSDIDSVEQEMYAMVQFGKEKRNDDVSESIIRIRGLIQNIRQGEKTDLGNIL